MSAQQVTRLVVVAALSESLAAGIAMMTVGSDPIMVLVAASKNAAMVLSSLGDES